MSDAIDAQQFFKAKAASIIERFLASNSDEFVEKFDYSIKDDFLDKIVDQLQAKGFDATIDRQVCNHYCNEDSCGEPQEEYAGNWLFTKCSHTCGMQCRWKSITVRVASWL